MSSPKKPVSDVVARLTDPKKYTGTHVHRFDDDGNGRGLAGRTNLVEFKGNTNTSTIESTVDKGVAKKPVVTAPLGKEKFGTQASKAPTIKLYRNGDKHHTGETYTVKQVKTMDQLLDKVTTIVKLPTGATRKIYKQGSKVSVKKLEELEDGGKYLCCGGEKPAEEEKLPAGWLTSE